MHISQKTWYFWLWHYHWNNSSMLSLCMRIMWYGLMLETAVAWFLQSEGCYIVDLYPPFSLITPLDLEIHDLWWQRYGPRFSLYYLLICFHLVLIRYCVICSILCPCIASIYCKPSFVRKCIFANIKRCEYVYYMHFIHKIRCLDIPLAKIKRRESVPGLGIAKLKRREQSTDTWMDNYCWHVLKGFRYLPDNFHTTSWLITGRGILGFMSVLLVNETSLQIVRWNSSFLRNYHSICLLFWCLDGETKCS